MDNNNLHKEIDLIQDCIKRMAHNSFMLKGWTITMFVIVLALTRDAAMSSVCVLFILLAAIISFWCLDAYFLRIERIYRKMYDWVLEERLQKNSVEHQYDLNLERFAKDVGCFCNTMFSSTLCIFYLPFVVILLLAILWECRFWICNLICQY